MDSINVLEACESEPRCVWGECDKQGTVGFEGDVRSGALVNGERVQRAGPRYFLAYVGTR